MSNPNYIELNTKDGLTLPGLLYAVRKSKKVAIVLHGNGSSSVFYDEAQNRVLADALEKRGIASLFFNNRGAHIIKKLNVKKHGKIARTRYGTAYEKIKECIEDIDGAIGFLKKIGFEEFYLIGESTGANKICVYNFYKPKNQITKHVLLSGGDDTGIFYEMLGKRKFSAMLFEAKKKIKADKGTEIMPELLAYDLIYSYISFYDTANPDGDYNIFPYYEVVNKIDLSTKECFRHFKSIKKPTLVVYGEADEFSEVDIKKSVDILKGYQPDFNYEVIKGADHSFRKHEAKMAKIVADWL